jgi:hypothetical protein
MKNTRADLDPSPDDESKMHLRKVTVTLPQNIYERLIQESAKRKIAGAPKRMLSALFREALTEYLDRLG